MRNRKEIKKEVVQIVSHLTPNELADIKSEAIMQVFDRHAPRFDIDFFEFAFLVEACIPPRPIARAMFWNDCVDKFFLVLTDEERCRLHHWLNKNHNYTKGVEEKEESIMWFENRYHPDNQYQVTCVFNGEQTVYRAFKHPDLSGTICYATKIGTFLVGEYITDIKKLDLSQFSQ